MTAMSPVMVAAQPVAARRFAVLGAGFGGVSVAWHLLQHTSRYAPISVDVVDEGGIGGGASGASGGLLHPYNPKGKLLWKGAEGWTAALRLLAVAEDAVSTGGGLIPQDCDDATSVLAWRRGILRITRNEKEAITFKKNLQQNDDRKEIDWRCPVAKSLVPGLVLPAGGLAVHIPQAINVHPQRYLQALWLACKTFAERAVSHGCTGTQAVLHREKIASLRDLTGSYDGVVVCLGAQAGLLPELHDKLPITTCRGVIAKLHVPSESSIRYPCGGPNLLSSTWLAAQGERNMLLGATKDWNSLNSSAHVSAEEGAVALATLLAETSFLPSISQWEVRGMQAGLRAVPPPSPLGTVPLAGCVSDLVHSSLPCVSSSGTKWWFLGGLGSRGLIHHAWLGEQLAKAVILRNEDGLPKELRRW